MWMQGGYMAFRFNNDDVRDYIASVTRNPRDDSSFLLVGFEGANLFQDGELVQLNDDAVDRWNGLVGYIGLDFGFFTATVKPGLFYTEHPTDPRGAAHLITIDQLKKPYHFQIGLHHGKYPCLVQAENFTVWRDLSRDGRIETGEPETLGQFGIHIHHAGQVDADVVGPWSAGCQVLQDLDDWVTFFRTVRTSDQTRWAYYLINAQQFAQWLTMKGRI
jgi:hypothetical protein